MNSFPSRCLFSAALLFSTIQLWSAERVLLAKLPAGATAPDAELDAAGVLHVAYFSADNVYYCSSRDNGATFSDALRVNSEPGTAQAGMYRGPDLALGRDGVVHIVWFTSAYQRKLPKDQWGVHYSQLPAGGKAFQPARNLNRMPSDNYSLAADAAGNVAVFWTAEKLFLTLSRDGGKTFAAAQPIAGADPCECCATRAYFTADGSLYCAYREKAQGLRDMYLVRLAPGATAFTRTKLSEIEWKINACPMTGCFLAASGAGALSAWETSGKASFARIDGAGKSLGERRIETKGAKKYPLALEAADGTVVLAWKAGKTLHWQLFDKTDQALGTASQTEAVNGDRPAGVVTADGTFILLP